MVLVALIDAFFTGVVAASAVIGTITIEPTITTAKKALK
jgi:hypothetical protein